MRASLVLQYRGLWTMHREITSTRDGKTQRIKSNTRNTEVSKIVYYLMYLQTCLIIAISCVDHRVVHIEKQSFNIHRFIHRHFRK